MGTLHEHCTVSSRTQHLIAANLLGQTEVSKWAHFACQSWKLSQIRLMDFTELAPTALEVVLGLG